MSLCYLPNFLSICRVILVIPIIFFLLKEQYIYSLLIFLIASITDALDGFIAKQFHCQTWLGSLLDPLADKILLVSLFIVLYYLHLVPVWLLAIILLRDIALIAGVIGYYYDIGKNKNMQIIPSNISKVNTVLQIFTILFVIIAQLTPLLKEWLAILYIIVATSTILSAIDYAWTWIKNILKPLSNK